MLLLLPQVRATQRSLGHAMQIVSTAVSYWEVLLQRHSPVQLGALASRGTWRDFLLHEASKFLGFPPRQHAPWQEGWQKLQATLLLALGSSPEVEPGRLRILWFSVHHLFILLADDLFGHVCYHVFAGA